LLSHRGYRPCLPRWIAAMRRCSPVGWRVTSSSLGTGGGFRTALAI
jgi:hypothetical protein